MIKYLFAEAGYLDDKTPSWATGCSGNSETSDPPCHHDDSESRAFFQSTKPFNKERVQIQKKRILSVPRLPTTPSRINRHTLEIHRDQPPILATLTCNVIHNAALCRNFSATTSSFLLLARIATLEALGWDRKSRPT